MLSQKLLDKLMLSIFLMRRSNFLSLTSTSFTAVENFVEIEFYDDFAPYPLIEIIFFGKRKKSTADTLTKQTVHPNLVPLG